MKATIGTMIGFYIIIIWGSALLAPVLFPGGGVEESYFYPIYMGIILLSGLIVICTKIVLEEIKRK